MPARKRVALECPVGHEGAARARERHGDQRGEEYDEAETFTRHAASQPKRKECEDYNRLSIQIKNWTCREHGDASAEVPHDKGYVRPWADRRNQHLDVALQLVASAFQQVAMIRVCQVRRQESYVRYGHRA